MTQGNVSGVGLQVPGAQWVPLPLEGMACPGPPPSALVCHAVLVPRALEQVEKLPSGLGSGEFEREAGIC